MEYFLETERLILRDFKESDTDALFEMESNALVHKYLGNKPLQHRDEALAYIHFLQTQYATNGIGRWATIEKASGNLIGWSGLKLVNTITNNKTNFYDVGYRLKPAYWGKGYATEAGNAAIQYGFTILQVKEIIGTCHQDNVASRKALEKCGLSFIEKFIYNDEIVCDWLAISLQGWAIKNT